MTMRVGKVTPPRPRGRGVKRLSNPLILSQGSIARGCSCTAGSPGPSLGAKCEGWCAAHRVLLQVSDCRSRRALMVITSSLFGAGSGGKQGLPFQRDCAEEVL